MFAKEDDTSSILQAENSFPWYYLANDARFMAIIVMIFSPLFSLMSDIPCIYFLQLPCLEY